jgi:hypothetical protein
MMSWKTTLTEEDRDNAILFSQVKVTLVEFVSLLVDCISVPVLNLSILQHSHYEPGFEPPSI